jgi:hypothetical protein
VVSRSIQNWDSALGFMQGVAKITKSSNKVEDPITGGVIYIAPSELTAPYILQEALFACSKEILDRDQLKTELVIHMNSTKGNIEHHHHHHHHFLQGAIEEEDEREVDTVTVSLDNMSTVSSGSSRSYTSSKPNPSTAAVDYRSYMKTLEEGNVVVVSNHFNKQVSQSLSQLQDSNQCLTFEQRYHDGKLPRMVSRKKIRQFSAPAYLNKFIPAPPSPCELANIYQSSSTSLEAKLLLAEIEAEKVVRLQDPEVLAEVRIFYFLFFILNICTFHILCTRMRELVIGKKKLFSVD